MISKYYPDRIDEYMLADVYNVDVKFVTRLAYSYSPIYDAMIEGYTKFIRMSDEERNSITPDDYKNFEYNDYATPGKIYDNQKLLRKIRKDHPLVYISLLEYIPIALNKIEPDEYMVTGNFCYGTLN